MESMASALKEAEQAMREVESEEEGMPEPSGLEETDDDREDQDDKKTRRRTYNSFGFDFGINNLLSDGEFIDAQNPAYAVRPLGSWYASFNSTNRTRIANKLFLEWGPGVSFYNFKFLNDDTRMTKSADGVDFVSDDREVDFIKSKLTAYYASFSLVPVIDFGGNRQKPGAFADRGSDAFRIGLGTYVSSRIDSYSKQVFKEEGERQRERNHDNFYMNNLRYGLRLQFGFRDTDFFFNYDLNELFSAGKGPKVNAFSFGVSF